MTKVLFSEDQFSPSILYPLQFRYKKNCWYIHKVVAPSYSGCNERTNEDLCRLLIVVRNEKLHIFVTCVGLDNLESHQTQRFYC